MHIDISKITIPIDVSIREAMIKMEICRIGIVLVVDAETKLIGTITDGDIRRANLANISLEESVQVIIDQKSETPYALPITASLNTDSQDMLDLLQQNKIRQLPLLNEEDKVVDLVTLDELVQDRNLSIQAVIMAGGFGTRLRPLTEQTPKPMLPVGDKPLMEVMLQRLKNAGIDNINIAVHHESDKITRHFGDGRDFGVSIKYVTEDQPLGTAGALGLMSPPNETMLVMNGDILTSVDFNAMLAFHREYGADLTVAVQKYDLPLPYGVIECTGPSVVGILEKPTLNFFLNGGIYMIEPSVHDYIPFGEKYDMTDLIQRLLDEGRSVIAFPLVEYWIDIGGHEEYEKAQIHMENQELGL